MSSSLSEHKTISSEESNYFPSKYIKSYKPDEYEESQSNKNFKRFIALGKWQRKNENLISNIWWF